MAAVTEIKKYLAEQEAEQEEIKARRESNVKAIKGLQEIRDFRNAMAEYNYQYEKSFEDEYAVGGMGIERPEGSEKELTEKYPQAAAYLMVHRESERSNYEIARIGRKALERFEDAPDEWETIVADMDKEMKEFVQRHIWD